MIRGSNDDWLFSDDDLDNTLRHLKHKMNQLVDNMQKDQFLATPEDRIIDWAVSQVEVQPLKIYDPKDIDPREITLNVPGDYGRPANRVRGTETTITIPFTGDSWLWKCRPNASYGVTPQARVHEGFLTLSFQFASAAELSNLKNELQRERESLRFYVEAQEKQLRTFNESLQQEVGALVRARKERIRKQDQIAEFLEIQLKHNPNTPLIDPLPIKRKLIKPLPPAPASYKPEPGIIPEEYEFILKIIRHVGRTFETTPKTFAIHPEEELRDIILANLNAIYEGGATGETFRHKGKTDIRIEDKNRAAFIAECKVWYGQNELTEAVTQLLGRYLTWRDCKAAIIIFNKHNAGFTEILQKIPEVLKAHPRFRREIETKQTGEWRYVLASQEDDLREITVHVFVFNLYVADKIAQS